MDLQEMSDRLEINNLLIDYCHRVDTVDIDRFDDIFTEDAVIDYSCFGFPRANLETIKEFLKKSLPAVPHMQHMISNSRVFINGDTATARTMCFNPMAIPQENGSLQMTYFHLWYVDKLVRTEKGWRIAERVEEKSHIFAPPGEIS